MKRKIGVWLRYGYSPTKGGGFSYYDTLLNTLKNHKFSNNLELRLISSSQCSNEDGVITLGLIPDKYRIVRMIARNPKVANIIHTLSAYLFRKRWTKMLAEEDIAYIYYVNQDDMILPNFPFVFTVWDMGYYMTYPFPELIQGRNFKGRKNYFDNILPRALLVFAESEVGKQSLVKYANIYEDKIKVVPIFAGNVIHLQVGDKQQESILSQYILEKEKFFFYPAQFWAHKNHITILHAFKEFVQVHTDYKLVFTGGDKGNKDYIAEIAKEMYLENHVLFLGYVSKEEMFSFYRNSTALVMASYFGPTNMPPIEAMNLDCPVICSDITGHHEILEDSALYFDPASWQSLYKAMVEITNNRDSYIAKIKAHNTLSLFNVETAILRLDEYFNLALTIRNTWR